MNDIYSAKQQAIADTPLFLFECRLKTGAVERWSTHRVTFEGQVYHARVLGHNLFEIKSSAEDGADSVARIALTLANADSYFSQIEWNTGWRGTRLSVRFLFFDLVRNEATTAAQTLFQGVGGSADEITESTLRVTFTNRLNLSRVGLPSVRIQKRCPWMFPSTAAQRLEAVAGGTAGRFSPFYACGYSADQPNGTGNLQADGTCYTACDFTRSQCIDRGMFAKDSQGRSTSRFGGIEFVPASVLVRSYGEKGSHLSTVTDNDAKYNDFAPLVYGTAWYQPPVVFARNDGNLTRMEILLAGGEIAEVVKVLVNDIEIPQGVPGANMTATGWYALVAAGTRSGAFNPDFTDAGGAPSGDPYGSMATLSLVVPNRISSGQTLPRVQVLLQGLKLSRYDDQANRLADAFTNNPAWVLLDVLRRSGWSEDDIDLKSFASTAAVCDQPIQTTDVHGNTATIPRFQCNLVLRRRRSAADIVRGIRNGSGLLLSYGPDGKLQLGIESTLAIQQPQKPDSSNSLVQLNGGWPAYEFSDGSARFSGILRKDDGAPHLRFWSRPPAETPNRLTVEFQDEFNEYQQDSLSIVDVDDAVACGQEVTAGLTALGLPNFDQASRVARLQLNRYLAGNLYVEFGTSVRGFGLAPGDIITITYEKEGLTRQPFRILRIAPGVNYRTATITAQIHDDGWYVRGGPAGTGSRRQAAFGVGMPRPLLGGGVNSDGEPVFAVTETVRESADGAATVGLSVSFAAPAKPAKSAAGIPLVSLTPAVSDGGSLAGGQTLYYAVSAIDKSGAESPVSFTARAVLPAGQTTYKVRLNDLSFSNNTVSFHVYRGTTPAQLARIAANQSVSAYFEDPGLVLTPACGPPDENFDHANFYWRFEVQPEVAASISSANSIGNNTLTMLAHENRGMVVRITKGKGAGQERMVSENSATTLTISPIWGIAPDATSSFVIAEPSWRFGALTVAGPAEFDVPNRSGATVHILGRSANVNDQECAIELSPVTRWRITGGSGSGDADVPPQPIFGFSPSSQGTIELAGVGFQDFKNTRSITSGTLTVVYWNELNTAPTPTLVSALAESDTTLELSAPDAVAKGDFIQLGHEIIEVTAVGGGGQQCSISRGAYGSAPSIQNAGSPVYRLSRRTYVVPFAREFFGSAASGSYSFPIFLPDVRVGAAEFFVTNDLGNSPTARCAFTGTADAGIRTLSGGQFSIQVDGAMAIQTDVAPPLLIEDAHSVRDVYAVLREPSTGGAIQLRVKVNSAAYCDLTVPSGSTVSNVVNGFGLPPLAAKSQMSVDIVSVPQDPGLFPGRDLTVTVRL